MNNTLILSLYAKILRRLKGVDVSKSYVDPTAKVEPGSKLLYSRFERHSFCGYDCTFLHVDVGSFCSIASGVSVGGAHHPIEFMSTSPVFLSHKDSVKSKFGRHDYLPITRTTIGHDVWIGERAIIKAGVNIGHGSVVGMGSVVTKDVPPYSIVAGNPARLIRMRFPARVIEALLRMNWWNLSDPELLRIGEFIDEPERVLRERGFL